MNTAIALKRCRSCLIEKESGQFYFIRQANDHEADCKACKKNKRKIRTKETPRLDVIQKHNAEPKPDLIEHERTVPSNCVDDIDYTIWEKRYGRVLTDLEKLEIKTNLTDFFKILMDERYRGKLQ